MRKKLLLLGALAVAIAAIGLIALFTRDGSSVCEKFIAHIVKGDSTASYNMFTDRGKTMVTSEAWAEQVTILQSVYGGQAARPLQDPQPITDNNGNITGHQQAFGIEIDVNRYKLTCFTSTLEPKKVDSFSSEIGF